MPEMTLQEALATDEVKSFLSNQIQEAAEQLLDERLPDAVKAAIEEQMPAIRESVREEIAAEGQVHSLHTEAVRLIEASPLKGAAKANLLQDYGLQESEDGDVVKPGRALALIEAEKDDTGKVTKTAKAVLKEAIDEDVKRMRGVLRESAPSVPRAPGGGEGGGDAPAPPANTGVTQRFGDAGLNPEFFGLGGKPKATA